VREVQQDVRVDVQKTADRWFSSTGSTGVVTSS